MRHLLLDLGGVFFRDWPPESFWPEWVERTGVERSILESWLSTGPEARDARLGRITKHRYLAEAAARHGADPAMFAALVEATYLSDFNAPLAAYVRELKARGVPVWALTNSLSPEADWLARPQFQEMFLGIVTSCELGVAKPDAEIFRRALARIGATASDATFVDDAPANVDGALALGLDAFQHVETEATIAQLEARFG